MHRVWFGAVTVMYVVFLVLLPPFQTNDEDAHWMRAWTVAEGHLTCAPIPVTVLELSRRFGDVRGSAPMTRALFDAARAGRGREGEIPAFGAPCMYIPLSYIGPALLLRAIAHPLDGTRRSRLLEAFYAARAFNLVLLAVGVILFMRAAPIFRSLTLLLYSLPMAIHQSVSINQESTILCLAFCLIVLWWSRPSVRQAQWLLVVVTLLALTKPTYLVFLVIWLAALLRLRRAHLPVGWSRIALLTMWGVVPLGLWAAWSYFVAARPEALSMLPGWVDVPQQIVWVKSQPSVLWGIVTTQFHDLLGREHLRGGWVSVLGVLGWADYEIGDRAYYALLAAVPLAFFADLLDQPVEASQVRNAFMYVLPVVVSALLIAAMTIALYFQFNAPGARYAMGMTGRYLHVPYFMSLTSALIFARERFQPLHRRTFVVWLQILCAALCLLAEHDAVLAILKRHYTG